MPFSIVNRGEKWFWCSYSLLDVRGEVLVGPFPSHEEAEKDARATLSQFQRSVAPAGPLTFGHRPGVAVDLQFDGLRHP
jgi:hypothetical protein